MCYKEITCPRCSSLNIIKNGKTANDKQRYLCKACRRQFITAYTYLGCDPRVRQMILPLTLNSSGIRDIARVLHVSPNTVLAALRRAAQPVAEPVAPRRIQALELDEFWSFVGSKAHQRWTWYGFERAHKQIVAFVNGRRTDANARALHKKLAGSRIGTFYTDDWQSYRKCLPTPKHRIGKQGTQNIERHNLNFRTHLKRLQRRTICFSKSAEMHDAVIKLYIHYSNNRQHQF